MWNQIQDSVWHALGWINNKAHLHHTHIIQHCVAHNRLWVIAGQFLCGGGGVWVTSVKGCNNILLLNRPCIHLKERRKYFSMFYNFAIWMFLVFLIMCVNLGFHMILHISERYVDYWCQITYCNELLFRLYMLVDNQIAVVFDILYFYLVFTFIFLRCFNYNGRCI